MGSQIVESLTTKRSDHVLQYFSDPDTYIRKAASQCIGKIYSASEALQPIILEMLDNLSLMDDFKIRQTVINASGEIGKLDFMPVAHFFNTSLFDDHPPVRNTLICSVKKMGEVNPMTVLNWSEEYLHHPDKEIRREICHGIELRGRKHPSDILPILRELENDKTSR